MACDLTAGRLLLCKNSVGGIRSILLLEVVNYKPLYNLDGTLVIMNTQPTTAYRYDLPKGTGNFSEAVINSSENGSTYYESTLTIKLHKLENAMRDELKLIAQNRLVIFILDNNDNQWVIGEVNGAELSTGTSATGVSLSDLSGYDLTFTSQEANPMRSAGNYVDDEYDYPWENIGLLFPSPSY
jgi:hypothetical protein